MVKQAKLKAMQYIRTIVKRIFVLAVILYLFSVADYLYNWENLVLLALFLKMILSVVFFFYLLRVIGDALREVFHRGKYMSIFPDAKEMILTEIYREMINKKKQKKGVSIQDLYIGELQVEDARTNSNNKK